MARTRIKGKGLTFSFGNPAVKYECDLVSAVLSQTDQTEGATDTVKTFCDANSSAGGKVWVLDIEAIQSTDVSGGTGPTATSDSLHTLVWNAAAKSGGEEIPFEFAPYGNATATPAQPHFTGIAVVPQGGFPAIGGSAGDNSFTWTYQFVVKDGNVTRKTA